MRTNGEMPLVIVRDTNKLRKEKKKQTKNKQFCGSIQAKCCRQCNDTTVVKRNAWMFILKLDYLLLLILVCILNLADY